VARELAGWCWSLAVLDQDGLDQDGLDQDPLDEHQHHATA
jgi:hypothetical protein